MVAASRWPVRPWVPPLIAGLVALSNTPALCQPATPYLHSAIYDPPRQRMVVFAGFDGAEGTNAVWQLTLGDDPHWDSLLIGGLLPSKRLGQSAIYDPVRDRMLCFGGDDGGVLADVWALSLGEPPTWSNLQPSGTSPDTRRYHTAIYDPPRDRMIVFGGDHGLGAWLNDVWSLWLTPTLRWERMTPSGGPPASRYAHSAVYDPVRNRMLVFGGNGPLNDLWALSLGETMTWTLLSPSGGPPAPRLAQSSVYDPVEDRMIIFGGNDGNQPLDQVWQLSLPDPPAWLRLTGSTDSPSPRGYHSAVLDSVYRRMVVFGGFPSVGEPTWALSLGPALRWSPMRPVIEVSPSELRLPTVTVGDTVSVSFTVSNAGLNLLLVEGVNLPEGMGISPPSPFQLSWNGAVTETLSFAPSASGLLQDSLVIRSNDPFAPRRQIDVSADVRGLEFETRILGAPLEAPLGVSLIVVATPQPGVRVEGGVLYYRISGSGGAFDSVALTPLATDFIAAIPASAVTEQGVDYFVKAENSGFAATQPPGAPSSVHTQAVAGAVFITAIPRPTSGPDYLVGRDIEVEVVLPSGAAFASGRLHYRPGGDEKYESDTLSLSGLLGRPVAKIPGRLVGSRGVEYWVEVSTLKSTLRFPAPGSTPAVIRTRVQGLVEPSEHAAGRYRLLTVPLDFGPDFSGSLATLLTDQLGTYDPVRWRAYRYVPDSLRNVEFSNAEAARFRPDSGRAFWLISRGTHRVDTAPIDGFSTPTGGDYPIRLAPGWNQFGNPFDFPVAWHGVARDTTAVGDPVAFDPSRGTIGDYADETPAVLAPFEGYFVHAIRAETLWIPPRAAPTQGPGSPASWTPKAAGGSESLWRFRLSARTEAAMDRSNALGLQDGAAAGFDPFDLPKPPLPPGPWVRVAFAHPDWGERSGEYRRDLRAPGSEGETWEIEVRGSTAGEPVTLELSEIVPAPSSLAMRMIDREQGSSIAWPNGAGEPVGSGGVSPDGERNAMQYRIVSLGQRPYRLAIIAGSDDYVGRAAQEALVIPARMTLDQNAPNPFGLATRIRFGLRRMERVRLEIYSVLGQRVAVPLEWTPLAPGFHIAVWDGRTSSGDQAPSGVYLMRLASDRETLTRRVALIRQ